MTVIENITVEDFKEYFTRDFPYLPIYNEENIYKIGDVVYNAPYFYESLVNDNQQPLTDVDSWKKVAGDKNDYILDSDITKAFGQAKINFNEELFGEEETIKIAYLWLTAFYLVIDIQASSSGLASSFQGFTSSKSVGDVSESFSIPQWMMNSPIFGYYYNNAYGRKYLSLLAPYCTGNIIYSIGGTTIG